MCVGCAQELAKQNEDMDCKVVARDVFSLLVSRQALTLEATRHQVVHSCTGLPVTVFWLQPQWLLMSACVRHTAGAWAYGHPVLLAADVSWTATRVGVTQHNIQPRAGLWESRPTARRIPSALLCHGLSWTAKLGSVAADYALPHCALQVNSAGAKQQVEAALRG
jgi:hypothetical protein